MKNTTLTMSFNTERLDALTYHMGKKEADLQEEICTPGDQGIPGRPDREGRKGQTRPSEPAEKWGFPDGRVGDFWCSERRRIGWQNRM